MQDVCRKLDRRRFLAGAAGAGAALLVGTGVGRRTPRWRGSGRVAPAIGPGVERLGYGGPQTNNSLNVAWPVAPPGLDPQATPSSATTSFACAAMSNLLRFRLDTDPQVSFQHRIEPDLAARWESPDGMTWIFHLRTDASFMPIPPVNGHAVESEDVRASFTRAAGDAQSQRRGVAPMFNASVIDTPDRQTAIFRLPRPYAPILSFLASVPEGFILPREALAGTYDPGKQMIGSGPFYLNSYLPGVAVVLGRSGGYFEQGLPYLDRVRQAVFSTDDEQVAQFTAGSLDMIRVGQGAMSTAVATNPAAQVTAAISDANDAIFVQLGDPRSPFQDIRLRRAVSESIDRSAIGLVLYDAEYDLPFAVNLTIGPSALHWDDLDAGLQRLYTYDPADAALLLRASGYEGSAVRLAYPKGAFGPEFDAMAQMIAVMLSALNWTVTLTPIDYVNDYLGGGSGYRYGNIPTDMMLLGRIHPYTNVDQCLFDVYSRRSPGNVEHVQDPAFEAQLDQARVLFDVVQMRPGYLDIQRYLADKAYAVGGLPVGYSYTIVQPYVQGWAHAAESYGVGGTWRTIWLND